VSERDKTTSFKRMLDTVPTAHGAFAFGDSARVRVTPLTDEAGVAGRLGTVNGITTVSLGYATNLLGDPVDDIAVNLRFDTPPTTAWLTPDLLEFVDHNPGTTIGVGDKSWVRTADGDWVPLPPGARAKEDRP
jgi:hypothetical protein